METRPNQPRTGSAHRLRLVGRRADDLLTVREVADYLKLSRATVYRLITTKALPHLRVSNAVRVRRGDLEAFITRSTQ